MTKSGTTEGLILGIRHMDITLHAVTMEVTNALSSPVSRFLMGVSKPITLYYVPSSSWSLT